MRLEAVFTTELDASDVVAAAPLQKKPELTLTELEQTLPHATLKLTERRPRGLVERVEGMRAAGLTGRLNAYLED